MATIPKDWRGQLRALRGVSLVEEGSLFAKARISSLTLPQVRKLLGQNFTIELSFTER